MKRMLRWGIGAALVLLTWGCNSGSETTCGEGETFQCPCPGGGNGIQVCTAEATFGECLCGETDDAGQPPACTPDCEERTCGPDGCDGQCGACANGEACNAGGACVELSGTCGDDVCEGGEDCATCAADCGQCCGNDECTGGESCATCPADCACGDDETCDIPARQCVEQGGAGGQGGQGGAGGQGGQGAAGGEGGEGGAGGAGGEGGQICEPACNGAACGDDGCGGSCGRCAEGALCIDGQCEQGECPGDTFECDGACVDLLDDINNCGFCGNRCETAWPEELDALNISFDDANIQAVCEAAECVFACQGAPEISAERLVEHVDHCGACGNACRDTGSNGEGEPVCLFGQCACGVGFDGQTVIGQVCGDTCVVATGRCLVDGTCCTTLEAGQTRRPALEPDALDHVLFQTNGARAVDITINAVNGRCPFEVGAALPVLLLYLDDQTFAVPFDVGRNGDCATLHFPSVPAGVHGIASETPLGPYNIELRFSAATPDLTVSGSVQGPIPRSAGSGAWHLIDAPRDLEARVEYEFNGDCNRRASFVLYDLNLEAVHRGEVECQGRNRVWGGIQLPRGKYLLHTLHFAEEGGFQIHFTEVELPQPPNPRQVEIFGPGLYQRPGFPPGGRDEIGMRLEFRGNISIYTAGEFDCPFDTFLALYQRDEQIASNDDAVENVTCSEITMELNGGDYALLVTEANGGGMPPYYIFVNSN